MTEERNATAAKGSKDRRETALRGVKTGLLLHAAISNHALPPAFRANTKYQLVHVHIRTKQEDTAFLWRQQATTKGRQTAKHRPFDDDN